MIVKSLRTFISRSGKYSEHAEKILRRVVALVVEARVMAEMALSPHKCAAPTAQHDTGRCAVELETKARYDFTITE